MRIETAKWDATYALGKRGEAVADELFKGLLGIEGELAVEVKQDGRAHSTGNLYIEYQQGGPGSWRPSGIAVTEAHMWAFVFPQTGVVLSVPTPFLKDEARAALDSGRKAATNHEGDMPSRGALVPARRFVPGGVS